MDYRGLIEKYNEYRGFILNRSKEQMADLPHPDVNTCLGNFSFFMGWLQDQQDIEGINLGSVRDVN